MIAAVGVIGVPFDANSSLRRGPAQAPAAIRRALGSEAGNEYSERGTRVWPSDAVVDHATSRLRSAPVFGRRSTRSSAVSREPQPPRRGC